MINLFTYQLYCFWDFSFIISDLWAITCHTLSPRLWCGSSCCNCVTSLNFVGLSVRKIWRTFSLSVSRPGELDLWPWNCCAWLPVGYATFLRILVFLWLFVLTYGPTPVRDTTWSCHLDLWHWRWYRLPVRKIWHTFSLSMNFELWTAK